MKILANRVEIKSIIFSLVLLCAAPVMAADNPPVFTPTSAWLVGPASLGKIAEQDSGQMPCVVANQFSNGFVVRLSGGGDQLMAMAIDFRQKAFTPRKKYEIEFSVPGQFFQVLQGAAYDEGTLLFSLYKFPEFYKGMKTADTLVIKVADAEVALNLTGLADGFRRMNECYQPMAPKAPATGAGQNPLIAKASGLTPMPGEISRASSTGPDPEMSVNAVLNDAADVPSPSAGSASALITGAKQANKDAKDRAASVPVRPEGEPMGSTWAAPKPRTPPNAEVMVPANGAAQPEMNGTQEMRWRALKGADLHDVLDEWARGSGVKLMWLAVQNFAVQRSISMSGDFTEATQTVLDQFSGQVIRPVGRLYREPGTTKLVLVVDQQVEKGE